MDGPLFECHSGHVFYHERSACTGSDEQHELRLWKSKKQDSFRTVRYPFPTSTSATYSLLSSYRTHSKKNGEGGIRTPGTGVYPYDGLANRCSQIITPEITSSCKVAKTALTPQLTPEYQKQGKIDTQKLPDDLAEIVAAWPELPEHIKAAIKALIQTHKAEEE